MDTNNNDYHLASQHLLSSFAKLLKSQVQLSIGTEHVQAGIDVNSVLEWMSLSFLHPQILLFPGLFFIIVRPFKSD
jgi:hypothetical protein